MHSTRTNVIPDGFVHVPPAVKIFVLTEETPPTDPNDNDVVFSVIGSPVVSCQAFPPFAVPPWTNTVTPLTTLLEN
jgi:hypothetical protein